MSYLVLARKWRPQTFADLVGQEHVVQTLKNAIAQGRIAHAFLFTGARGVGKTTIARVMAKALNCTSAAGPTPEPCAKCDACTEIARGNDTDVQEIDGASNNSVDDVRRLQESLPYLPQRDRFKVVIVDEVHMLSSGAFNALLKTLEEPPPHVKFIFATTEVHKVPVTILSRCQRYDFKLIPTQKIRDRVDYILNEEGVAHDAASVALVAREAAGSMRDALSLLDQVIAGGRDGLKGEEAARLLGVADRAVLYELARSLLVGNAAAALETVNLVSREGYDLANVARGFLNVLRDLVISKVVPDPSELMDLADEERADVVAIAKSADAADLERLFAAWSRTTDEVARAREPRWVIEMALVRLAHRPPLVPVDELIARLADLEKRLGGGPDTRGPSPGGGAPRGGAASGGGGGGARPAAQPGASGAVRYQPQAGGPGAGVASSGPVSSAISSSAPRGPVAAAAGGGQPAWLARAAQYNPQAAAAAEQQRESEASAQPRARSIAPAVTVIDTSGALASLDAWEKLLDAMENGPIGVLEHAVPLEVGPERVRFAFEAGSFYARKVASGEAAEVVAIAAEKVLGVRPEVEIVQGALPENAPSIARRKEQRRNDARAARETAARAHPFVQSFVSIVGGEVRQVKLDDKD